MPESQATFWKQATLGVNYVRAHMPAKHLPGHVADHTLIQNENHWEWAGKNELGEPCVRFTDQQGMTAVWMFPGRWEFAVYAKEQQNNGIRVLVEVDDLYLTESPTEQWSEWAPTIAASRTTRQKVSYEAHEKIVGGGWIDGMIVSTPQLKREYSHLVHPDRIFVCRNCVDPDDWPETPEHQIGGVLRVGWAASPSHVVDAPLVLNALRMASLQPKTEVVLLGIHAFSPMEIWETGPAFTHDYIPPSTLADYRRNYGRLDVALCPVYAGRWNDCKSDLKAMEAAMAGALPIVARTEAYREWWDKPWCLTAENASEFTKHVRWCIRNRDAVAEMAADAKAYVLAERTIQGNIWRWREACKTRELIAA